MKAVSRATQLLSEAGRGSRAAINELFTAVYAELHELAAHQLHHERRGHTLQPTALVNEAFLRLVGQSELELEGRAQFFALAAKALQRILIEHARRRKANKRGGNWHRVTLDPTVNPLDNPEVDLLALSQALEQLAERDERMARIVELRFYGGLTVAEVADALRISNRTVAYEWALAKGWLRRELAPDSQGTRASARDR